MYKCCIANGPLLYILQCSVLREGQNLAELDPSDLSNRGGGERVSVHSKVNSSLSQTVLSHSSFKGSSNSTRASVNRNQRHAGPVNTILIIM